MGERIPKPLDEVLTYLDGLGFDHLYVSRPSTTAPEPARRGPAERRGPASRAEAPPRPAPGREPSPSRAEVPTSDAPAPAPAPADELPTIPERPSPQERGELFARVQSLAAGCTACSLSETRKSVVFGSGHADADLMLIGEGPGSEEDRQGLPFVGPAGALLTRILQAIDLRRDEVYIANVVKCRPPRNRDPKPDEVIACRGYLERQIALVQPKVIVALGRVAAQALLNTSESLGRLRGRWHRVQGVETRVTYHPAALLRNESWKRPTWEDMKVVRDRLRSGD